MIGRRIGVVAALVVSLAGSSAASASAATASAAASASVRTTAENRALAHRDARRLLATVALPPGATPSATEPAGDGGVLGFVSRPAGAALADDHRFLVVASPLSAVQSFYADHVPPGTRSDGTGWSGGPGIPPNGMTTYAVTRMAPGLAARWVIVDLVALGPDSTGIRIDAQVTWLVERLPSEVVPAGVRSIGVTESRGRRVTARSTLRRPRAVAAVIRSIDTLPVGQPGVLSCPAEIPPVISVRLVFRGADGMPLAVAEQPFLLDLGGPCATMTFSVRGRSEPSLLDGGPLLRRVAALAGIDLHVPRG